MFLKSLTLRGFKSFADKTVLEFEPGITVIVGPNGSGKSNVVDAIAWVLGEHRVKSLRGGKMEDVIFAGTAARPALGRAEVALTIDNSAGLLPIDYTEVTMTRLLYRSGESEYFLNGAPCRLLDLQELLSDTGVGRELHTLIGQGQLDEVLHGRPEDRRAAIEEAAGVYKHRRRKDKALRKLASMEPHLLRLSDLVGELRRQLKPLAQQAETARRAAEVAAELREVRLVLRARELAAARRRAAALAAEEAAFNARLAELEAAHSAAQAAEQDGAAHLAADEPAAAGAGDTVHRLTTVRARLQGTMALAEQRARHLAEAAAGQDEGRAPADLEREAAELAGELAGVRAEAERAQAAAQAAEARRGRARAALAGFDQAAAAGERDRAKAQEQRARLAGEAASLARTIDQHDAEAARLRQQQAGLAARRAEVAGQLAALQAELAELDDGEAGLADALADAEAARDAQAAVAARLAAEERRLDGERTAARARRQALEAAARMAGGDVLAALEADGPHGVLGPLAPALSVAPGFEAAVAAALGPDADAIVVAAAATAGAAAELLRERELGRATFLHPEPGAPGSRPTGAPPWGSPDPSLSSGAPPWGSPDPSGLTGAPPEARLLGRVRAAGPAAAVAQALLADVLVADDLADARALRARHPAHRVVTRRGELVAAGRVEGGAAPEASLLAARRAADQAAAAAAAADAALDALGGELRAAQAELAELDRRVAAAAAALHAADARLAGATDRLAKVNAEQHGLELEAGMVAGRLADLAEARRSTSDQLGHAQTRLAGLAADRDATPAPDPAARAALVRALEEAEQRSMAARVAAATVGERQRLLAGRVAALTEQAAAAARTAARRAEARARRLEGARRAGQAARLAAAVLARLEGSLRQATAERDELTRRVQAARTALAAAGARRREAAAALEAHHTRTRASDQARLEADLKADELARRILEEFAVDPDDALADYLPGPDAATALPATDPRRLPDAELRRSAAALDRRLALLGRVNPLALEEFQALQERYGFLSGQLQDLKETRRDLLKVVRAVDERVREVFGAAFGDVAREFERTFALLFPGGQGRLVLTDPDDLLTTGVEVEARPPGKRVRRLSLLSGGERSLVALAFCFAVFRARPSPFYVLDEVEAALDDVNLQRFLDLLADARDTAQLLVVSHQRRTMEAADALYGVSMQAGGVTKVVSQRLRAEPRPARGMARPRVGGVDPAAVRIDDVGAGDATPVEVR